MQTNALGSSDLQITPITLGCMSFGESQQGTHEWTIPEDESRVIIKAALEAGITTYDTANSYSAGTGEEFLGRALKDFAKREDIVLATKVFFPMGPNPEDRGLSAKAIEKQAEDSLRRLGTDYIDLYQIHRWDPTVPIEETLTALDNLVQSGKVRYLGASSMFAWQFAKALFTADARGLTRFISMQDHYNLLNREEEREMHGLCLDQGIGVIPWSPLARGLLARPAGAVTGRTATDLVTQSIYTAQVDADNAVIDRVGLVAAERGIPRAQVALAWVRQQPVVSSVIVGATKLGQLDDAIASLSVELTPDELASLEEPYVPHGVVGFS